MKCRKCGKENRPNAKFCGDCGESLLVDVDCRRCGSTNPAGQNFCDNCGASLKAAEPQSSPGPISLPSQEPTPVAETPAEFGDGRYVIKRFLGEGGRKRVYLAHDNSLDRDVAVALIKTAGLDEGGVMRARREAEAMGRLGDHAHIVTVYDIGEEAGQLYIVSQFMAGGDLHDLMERSSDRRVSVEEAIRVGAEVARGLEHAHAHGIIHRDVKPRNVWLTEDGTAKLGDFGLAVALDRTRMTLEGMMVGTVAYMPPEQGLGRPADARSDLYSLGTLLYELVCGRPPFVGEDAIAVISQHINTAPVAPTWHNASVPHPLEELILKLLAKAPDERPASAGDVAKALEMMLSGEFVSVEPIAHDRANPLDRLAGGVFVGRERETTELRAALEAVLSGRARLVTLVGEMGIGKTRMAAELGTYASLRGAQVLWGRCYEGQGAPAYWPWVQVIRSYVHDHDPETLASELGSGASDIAQLVSDIHDRLPTVAPAPQLDPEQARFRLFDAIATFLRNASVRQPLVVILDDLHWADRSSLLLLQFLATELTTARVLIVGAYRDADLGVQHPLSDVLAQLRRERVYKRVLLRGLSFEEVRALLESVAEHELRPQDLRLVKALHRETEGNPFFIEEIVRHLVETGRLVRREGRWAVEAESIEELGIPEGVRETLGRRIERLSEQCRTILLTASVIGREFELAVLQGTADESPDQVLEALDEALEARILQPATEGVGRYRFGHGLTRETLYDQLTPITRMRLHERVGTRLEELNPGGGAATAELAYHYTEAIQLAGPEKAAIYGQLAGDRAMTALAYEDAIGHYSRALQALELMRPLSDGRLVEILLALGDARWRAGDTERARETFLEAAGLARRSGTAEQLAQAALGYGSGLGWFGFVERADSTLVDLLEEALDVLPDADSVLRVRVLARLAVELYYTHDVERRSDLSRQALAMAERIGDPEARLIALYSRQSSVFGPRSLDERMRGAEELIAAAEAVGSREMAFRARHLRFRTLLELGEIDAAQREQARLEELAAELREPFYRWQVGMFRAMDALRHGRVEDSDRLAQEAFAIGQRGQPETAAVLFGAQTAVNRWAASGLEELMPGAEALVERYPWLPVWRAVAGFFYTELGRLDDARRHLEVLVDRGFEQVPRDGNWLLTMFVAGVAIQPIDDRRYAEPVHALLEPFADRWVADTVGDVWLGSVGLALGCTATVLGRFGEAEEYFNRFNAAADEIGPRPTLAHGLLRHGLMLIKRGAPGDRDRARDLVLRALDVAEEVGMPSLVERLLPLKLDLQGVVLSDDIETSLDAVARSVEQQRPDLTTHAAPDGTVTLLFSDIEGSTAMTERLGDRRWLELLAEHNRLIRREVAAHGGFEVKSQGDGFMIAFSSARRALHCAVGMQRALSGWSAAHPSEPLRIRVGLHTGEALKDGDDFFGRNVIVAARVAAEAQGGEVLASSLLRELTASSAEIDFGTPREVELKGLNGVHRVFPVVWEEPREPAPAPAAAA